MNDSVLGRVLTTFPKKSENFSDWHTKRFYNAIKFENDDVRIRGVSFNSKYMHYNLCK
jgi:hypothetical protein